ncbi:hypothetical protein B0I35DRAFT_478226 [Stachybotrys elegans]|uniref:Uncharacterized protein n=1 Tax=Stachybotrys elegans TaxID=80388 RepID=A0A8K0WT35_9HYPO|nr:hypothetical protein B0I35DRAFT_478226 [Stachybotrys elegans]
MSSDNGPNNNGGSGQRRSSFSQATLNGIFQRGNSVSGGTQPTPIVNDPHRRRLSITTLGLSGTSPNNAVPFGMRRGSISTNSDSIDESAIDEDDAVPGSARTAPTTPFVRHMSFGANAMRGFRPGGSPGNGNSPYSPPPPATGRPPSVRRASHVSSTGGPASPSPTMGRRASHVLPPTSSLAQASNIKHPRTSSDKPFSRIDQQGYNWSEQLRSRAESTVSSASRPSFSFASGAGASPQNTAQHDRTKSVSDMPQPPTQAAAMKPKQERPKPDAFQERILKGDFYMD